MADLIVRILGESSGLTSELDKLKGHLSTASSGFSGFSKVAGIAGLALGSVLVAGLAASVHAAIEGQASQAALDAAVKATGQSVKGTAGALDAAQSSARNYGFTNEDARTALAKLEVATHSTKASVTDMSAVMDLAAFKNESLASAAQTVARTLSGSTRAVSQLGIAIIPVTSHVDALKAAYGGVTKNIPPLEMAQAKLADKMATGAKAVQLMSEKLKGQAAAAADTAAGKMRVFHAQVKAIEESLGNALLPVLVSVSGALASFAGYMANHTTLVKILVGALGALSAVLIAVGIAQRIWAAATAIASAASAIFTEAQWALNAALAANPIGIVIIALAILGVALYEAWEHSATFRAIVTAAFDAVKTVVVAFIGFFITTLPNAFNTVLSWVRSNWPIIAVLISGPFAPLVALATNAFGVRSAIISAFQSALDGVRSVLSGVYGVVTGAFSALPGALYSIGTQLLTGLAHGITDGLGSALSAVRHAAGSVVSAAKSILHINSPSLVFHEIGMGIMEGMRNGIDAGTAMATNAIGNATVSVVGSGLTAAAPQGIGTSGASGSVVNNYNITLNGAIGDQNALMTYIRNGLVQLGHRSGPLFGGYA